VTEADPVTVKVFNVEVPTAIVLAAQAAGDPCSFRGKLGVESVGVGDPHIGVPRLVGPVHYAL
jgi:hypothetical protein